MLSRDGARLQVFLDLRNRYGVRRGSDEIVILDGSTIERPWGWVFFYNSRGSQNGEILSSLVGNAPYMVNRYDGSVRFAWTGRPIEFAIEDYEAELERKAGAWELAVDEPAGCPVGIAAGLRSALRLSISDLASLRRRLPCVWQAGAKRDLEPLLERLTSAGVRATLRPVDRISS